MPDAASAAPRGSPSDAGFRRRLERLPKAELHVHLDGSLRPETMLEIAAATGKPMPRPTTEALRDYMRASDARNLVEYLERFDITLSVMQTAEALERIAYELAVDLAAENVRYAEIRYSPVLNTREGLSLDEAVAAPLRGLERARRETGIRTAVIVCALRHLDPSVSLELAELAVAFRGRGVVGFDLAGAEADYPAKPHREAFYRVRRENMAVTVHAGEAYGPPSIRQALHDCGAHRLGHGTRLFEDERLMAYVRDFRIPLEICLTSNVQTRVVSALERHPLRRYFEAGIRVSLNTDNRLISGTTVTEEYWRVHRHLGLGWPELVDIARMGFDAAFLPWPEKEELVRGIETEIRGIEDESETGLSR